MSGPNSMSNAAVISSSSTSVRSMVIFFDMKMPTRPCSVLVGLLEHDETHAITIDMQVVRYLANQCGFTDTASGCDGDQLTLA